MFWGLIMEPKRRYSQSVKRAFHISMAALDLFSADDNPTQLMLFFENRNYLLCTLQKGHTVQCPLDLNFEAGDEVVFATNGNCNIHLSGYLQEDQLDYLDGDLEEEEEEGEADEEEVAQKQVSKQKRLSLSPNEKPASKKSKLESILKEDFDTNDEDDDSYVMSSDDDAEEEEDEDGEEEEEEDSDDDDEEDEEVVPQPPIKVMNGEKPKSLKKQKEKAKNEKPKNEAPAAKQKDQKNAPQQKRTVEGGVVIQDIRVGEGAIAKSGKVVQVYYEGRLKNNNKLFDQSNKGSGFKFRLGKQEVIKGWDVGVVGMKVGGRRRITCPAPMAYGQKGSPPAIPPNATLIFDVELKNVI
ncbi:46 kDa FK506-binding nuclear protein-like [Photinus pyralis]|uniref:peptidylprolyl isomerase n=1 Tax=Photinus pyralis TaxID=7054 RepID=A0A1Y1M7E6_PHOPY|nr:46 kDa FK506-binding nuclear protein-like [Photinus pyralis]XP_031347915.1 46 kDa FK506-binding nuclear protein-like [Photinus pyralis]